MLGPHLGVGEQLDPRDAQRGVGLRGPCVMSGARADRLHLIGELARALLIGFLELDGRRRVRRPRRLFARAQQRAGALLHGLGLGALHQPVEHLVGRRRRAARARDRGVGVLAARRDRLELRRIGQSLDRDEPGAGVAGMAGDAAERLLIGDLFDRGAAHRLERRRARHARQLALTAERGERRHGAERRALVALLGERDQPRRRVIARRRRRSRCGRSPRARAASVTPRRPPRGARAHRHRRSPARPASS